MSIHSQQLSSKKRGKSAVDITRSKSFNLSAVLHYSYALWTPCHVTLNNFQNVLPELLFLMYWYLNRCVHTCKALHCLVHFQPTPDTLSTIWIILKRLAGNIQFLLVVASVGYWAIGEGRRKAKLKTLFLHC